MYLFPTLVIIGLKEIAMFNLIDFHISCEKPELTASICNIDRFSKSQKYRGEKEGDEAICDLPENSVKSLADNPVIDIIEH